MFALRGEWEIYVRDEEPKKGRKIGEKRERLVVRDKPAYLRATTPHRHVLPRVLERERRSQSGVSRRAGRQQFDLGCRPP